MPESVNKAKISNQFQNIFIQNIREYSMFIVLAIIFLVFTGLTGGINASSRNITNIFIQNSYILVLAVGMVLVIISGNIDLSVGSLCAFTGAVSAICYNAGAPMWLAIVVAVVVGGLSGAFQGFWIAFLKVPSFIVTLAGMLLFRGLAYIITDITPITPRDSSYKYIVSGYVPDFFSSGSDSLANAGSFHYFSIFLSLVFLGVYVVIDVIQRRKQIQYGFNILPRVWWILKLVIFSIITLGITGILASYRGIPNVVIIMVVVVWLFVFITKRTVLGRYIYAVGGNKGAAKLSGINSELVTLWVFVIMGMLAGLSGVIFTAYLNSALPQAGELFELEAIAATFIGGASAAGGIGTIIGAVIGGLVMGVINNGMSLMNLGAAYQLLVKALVLLIAVWYDLYSRKYRKK